MKIFQKFGFGLVFILAFAALAIAQTEKEQSSDQIKIAFVDASKFEDEKVGIKELAEIVKKLSDEFKSQTENLKLLDKKHQYSTTELRKIADDYKLTGSAITKEFLDDKIKEHELLTFELERQRKEIKLLHERRKFEVTEKINKKIGEIMKQFAKEKGYEMILDVSAEATSFVIASWGKPDVTDEFIKYYNSLAAKQQ